MQCLVEQALGFSPNLTVSHIDENVHSCIPAFLHAFCVPVLANPFIFQQMTSKNKPGRRHASASFHEGLGDRLTTFVKAVPYARVDVPETFTFTKKTWTGIVKQFQRALPPLVDIRDVNKCWALVLAAGRGYGTLHVKNQQFDKRFNAHRLIFKLYNPTTEVKLGDRTMQVSHLCHNGMCINPAHLAFEGDLLNKDRTKCAHGSAELCPHDPKCIFPTL